MIVLATRDPNARRRWHAALANEGSLRDAADADELTRLIGSREPHVVLLDLAARAFGRSRTIPVLLRRNPRTRVIALTPRMSEREGLAVLRAGAHGYCARSVEAGLLRKAVTVVQKGEVWAGRALIARLVDALARSSRRRTSAEHAQTARRLRSLTVREREIALLVGGGAANKEIADRLGVTERTVKAHLTAIFRKLGVSDRLRLALAVNGSSAPPPALS